MNQFKIALITVMLALPFISDAQRWKFYRNEVGFAIGTTSLMGDVGGGKDLGKNLFGSVTDLDISASRFSANAHFMRMMHQRIGILGSLNGGVVAAGDRFTEQVHRAYRNFRIRTIFVEAAAIGRFYLKKESFGHVYKLRGTRNFFFINLSIYAYGGIGATYFNPQAPLNGKWYSLRPLGTEGQNVMPGKDPYKRFTVVWPVGFGAKYAVNNKWNVGIEYGARKTYTDYFEDVSTLYYDKQEIADFLGGEQGAIAAALSDPSSGEFITHTAPGERRGDPGDKDFYMHLQVSLNYRFIKGTSFKPRF